MPDRRLDPTFLRAQIEALRHTHPGIWDAGDETLLGDMIEAETSVNEFLAAVVRRKIEAEKLAEGAGDLMSDYKARWDAFKQRAEAMRRLAHKVMDWAELRKVVLPIATVWINAGQPKVIITDEAALPPDCLRVRTEPNSTAIEERLARGEHVAGAEMSNAEPFLNMRVK